MFMEIGRTAYPDGGRQNTQGNNSKGNNRERQRKLQSLIDALKANDLPSAKAAYAEMVKAYPSLSTGLFRTIEYNLASANMAAAKRMIEQLYGQGQTIFKSKDRATSFDPALLHHGSRGSAGYLVDCTG